MYAKYAKTLILAAGLTLLGSTPAAWAQYRSYDRPYSTYDQNYGQMARAAHEIQETAATISYQAFRNNRRPDDDEAQALDRLRELSSQARHYQWEVGRFRQDPQQTMADFQVLANTFDAAADALANLPSRPYVERGMSRIALYLDQLAPYYGQSGDFRIRFNDRVR
ncbi:MAG TPA: hypothetical protein VFE33_36255 [Thermoanaerobaculia bacterium]|nr:hypothetical protein [Thermoanaerobaculia bacterium]